MRHLAKARAFVTRRRQRLVSPATVRQYTRGTLNRARYYFECAARAVLVGREVARREAGRGAA